MKTQQVGEGFWEGYGRELSAFSGVIPTFLCWMVLQLISANPMGEHTAQHVETTQRRDGFTELYALSYICPIHTGRVSKMRANLPFREVCCFLVNGSEERINLKLEDLLAGAIHIQTSLGCNQRVLPPVSGVVADARAAGRTARALEPALAVRTIRARLSVSGFPVRGKNIVLATIIF